MYMSPYLQFSLIELIFKTDEEFLLHFKHGNKISIFGKIFSPDPCSYPGSQTRCRP
jgi:hypothetical protein